MSQLRSTDGMVVTRTIQIGALCAENGQNSTTWLLRHVVVFVVSTLDEQSRVDVKIGRKGISLIVLRRARPTDDLVAGLTAKPMEDRQHGW